MVHARPGVDYTFHLASCNFCKERSGVSGLVVLPAYFFIDYRLTAKGKNSGEGKGTAEVPEHQF